MRTIGVALVWFATDRTMELEPIDPETDTPHENKQTGERIITLSSGVCLVLDNWFRGQRPDVTDDYG